MSIAAANVAPDFSFRRKLVAEDLRRLQEPAVIFEHDGVDDEGERFFVYTVAGWLDGVNVATRDGGCTVGGEVILIAATSREDADAIACIGLHDTIVALDSEEKLYQEAHAAQARLATIGVIDRMTLAQAKPSDKSTAFVEDADKLRILAGDDIVLTAGRVH
jgi:hypothetical protein